MLDQRLRDAACTDHEHRRALRALVDRGPDRLELAMRAHVEQHRALRGAVAASRVDQARRHALLVVEQSLQQMRWRNPLMVLADGNRLGRLQEAARAISKLLKIHSNTPLTWGRYWCDP